MSHPGLQQHGTFSAYNRHGCRCDTCKKAEKARRAANYRKARKNGYYAADGFEPCVPVGPLKALLEARADSLIRTADSMASGRAGALGIRYAAWASVDLSTAKRALERIFSGETTKLRMSSADKWSLFLGYPLSMVYPELYE